MASSDPHNICFKCRGSLHFCQLCETVNSSTIRSWRARTVSLESFRLSSPDALASKRRKVQEGRGELTSATPPASISVLSPLRTSRSQSKQKRLESAPALSEPTGCVTDQRHALRRKRCRQEESPKCDELRRESSRSSLQALQPAPQASEMVQAQQMLQALQTPAMPEALQTSAMPQELQASATPNVLQPYVTSQTLQTSATSQTLQAAATSQALQVAATSQALQPLQSLQNTHELQTPNHHQTVLTLQSHADLHQPQASQTMQ